MPAVARGMTGAKVVAGPSNGHARGSAPQFTSDGRFVVFTILPPRAADDDAAAEAQALLALVSRQCG